MFLEHAIYYGNVLYCEEVDTTRASKKEGSCLGWLLFQIVALAATIPSQNIVYFGSIYYSLRLYISSFFSLWKVFHFQTVLYLLLHVVCILNDELFLFSMYSISRSLSPTIIGMMAIELFFMSLSVQSVVFVTNSIAAMTFFGLCAIKQTNFYENLEE